MGSEPFANSTAPGKRGAKRARVLLSAKLKLPKGEAEARLRDLSRRGALVECAVLPPVGSQVLFVRGEISVPARVAWTGGNRIGLEFAYMIDEHEVLVQLGGASKREEKPRFRPLARKPDMTDQERQLAAQWEATVGIAAGD